MQPLDREIELATRAILASEEWAPAYGDTPLQHAELIKLIAKLQRQTMVYLRDLKKQSEALVNWSYYRAQSVQAYNVQVMVNENEIQRNDRQFIKIIFETVSALQQTGFVAADTKYDAGVDLQSTIDIIDQLTTEQVGALVGKRLDDAGLLIDNPDPRYNVDNTTRDLINNAIKKSLNLGLSKAEAQSEVERVIANPARAANIAETEGVRAYSIGQHTYATNAGYKGKYATTAGAKDYCLDNEAQGVIPIDQAFSSGAMYTPFHNRCRCATNYTVNLPTAAK